MSSEEALLPRAASLSAAGAATRDECERLDADAAAEMERAVAFALESPYPDPGEACKDAYA